jgi:shikimate kinase
MNPIYLIGPMGSGKTTLGKLLAESMGFEFVDLDEWIEKEEGRSIQEIFSNDGESYFRDMETLALLTTKTWEDTVVACGGGIVELENNCMFLKTQKVINLMVDVESAIKRINHDKKRPLLHAGESPKSQWNKLYKRRLSNYTACADFNFSTQNQSLESTLSYITLLLGLKPK